MPFEKGQSGNPAGRPSGRQAFIDRASRYLEEFTIDELMALAKDQERFGRLPVIDGMIVRRLAVALAKGDGADMDRILDRIIGKSAPYVAEKEKEVTLADLILGSYEK